MKTITLNSALVAILCLASANGWAQDYPTMLEGNPKWICLASDVDGEPTFKTFYLDGDTTINGKTYQKLYYEWMYKNGKSVLGHPVNIAALREYDGKVLAAKAFYQEMFLEIGNYYEAFEERSDEVVVYDWNVLREAKSVKVFQDGKTTEREIVERTITDMSDGSKRIVYKLFNHDPENLRRGQQAYVEIIDQVGCINMPKELVHYLWEPKNITYSSSLSKVIVGTTMDFIQNNMIVYRAPINAYVSYDFIKDLVPTGIEEIIHNAQFIMHNDAIYNLQGQRINGLQKGLNIVNGKKVFVR